jgi:Dolichyl-phosphate-mannose-protein mannosyltransferase
MDLIDQRVANPKLTPAYPGLKTNQHAKRTLLFIFLVGSVLRIASFCLSENAGGDALARAALTAQWLQNPSVKFDFGVWLPMHFWMMGALSLIVRNVELAGRLLSLILGIASIVAFWGLAEELDGRETAAFSSILFAFYSLHIAYSVTSSCDGPYLFFVLAGLALFFRWRKLGGYSLLCLGGLSLTLGSGIRYEAWVVIFALDLILLYRRQWQAFGFFAPISGLWPGFWMAYEWLTRGNPLYAPVLNHTLVAQDLSFYGTSLKYRLLLPPGAILIALSPLVLIGIPVSIRYIAKQKGLLCEFAFVVSFFALAQFYQIFSGGVMAYARYTLTLGTMAAVLSGIGLRQILPHKRLVLGVMSLNLVALLVLSFVDNPFINKVRSVSPVLRFVPYLHDTGKFLSAHLGPNDAVVIDNYNYEANQLAILAGMPLLEQERAFEIPDATNRLKQSEKVSQLLPYLRYRHPKYLVYANRGELRAYLPFPAGCTHVFVERIYFYCVFQNSQYRIFEIQY